MIGMVDDSFWGMLFWVVIVVYFVLMMLLRLRDKKLGRPMRKPRKLSPTVEKRMRIACDVIIFFALAAIALVLFGTLKMAHFWSSESPEVRKASYLVSITVLIIFSARSAIMVGLLSWFQKNLNIAKRVILLILSLAPVVFTILLLILDWEEGRVGAIKLGLACWPCWLLNGPAIVLGKPFVEFMRPIFRLYGRLVGIDICGIERIDADGDCE